MSSPWDILRSRREEKDTLSPWEVLRRRRVAAAKTPIEATIERPQPDMWPDEQAPGGVSYGHERQKQEKWQELEEAVARLNKPDVSSSKPLEVLFEEAEPSKTEAFMKGLVGGASMGALEHADLPQIQKQTMERSAEEFPTANLVGELSGAFVPIGGISGGVRAGIPALKATGQRLLTRMGKEATAEGIGGAIYGALESVASGDAENPEEVLTDALEMAALFGGFGAAGPAIGAGAKATWGKVKDWLGNRLTDKAIKDIAADPSKAEKLIRLREHALGKAESTGEKATEEQLQTLARKRMSLDEPLYKTETPGRRVPQKPAEPPAARSGSQVKHKEPSGSQIETSAPQAAAPKAKEPWEMTVEEWTELAPERTPKGAEDINDVLDEIGKPYQVKGDYSSMTKVEADRIRRAERAFETHQSERGRVYEKALEFAGLKHGYINFSAKEHRLLIHDAIKQGKPVPREILEEYATEPWAKKALAAMEQPKAKEPSPVVYHGTRKEFSPQDISEGQGPLREGIYTSASKEIAQDYAGKTGSVYEYSISSNAKVLDLSEPDVLLAYIRKKGVVEAEDITEDLTDYILSGRLFQYDITSGTSIADDVMSVAKRDGYDVVNIVDDLGAIAPEGNVATVVLNKKVLTPAKPPSVAQEAPESVVGAKLEPGQPEPMKDVIGLSKAENSWIRDYTKLPELPEPTQRKWATAFETAKRERIPDNAIELANRLKKNMRPISDKEAAGLGLKIAELTNQWETAVKQMDDVLKRGSKEQTKKLRAEIKSIRDDIDLLTSVSVLGTRESARSVAIHNAFINRQTYNLASVVREAEATAGRRMSEPEIMQFTKWEQKYKEVDELYKKTLADNERLIAEAHAREAEIAARRATKRKAGEAKAKKQIAEEESIKTRLVELGFSRMNEITGLTAEASYLMGRLALSYMKRGATNFEGAVKKVIAEFPTVKDIDVYRGIIAKDPARQAVAKTGLQRDVAQFRSFANWQVKVDDAMNGIFAPGRTKPPTRAEITKLQKLYRKLKQQAYRSDLDAERLERVVGKINEAQDQLSNHWRRIPGKKPRAWKSEELQQAEQIWRDLKKQIKVDDDIAKLESYLRTGEVPVKEVKVPVEESEALIKARIQKRKLEAEVRDMIRQKEKSRGRQWFEETINTSRTLKATADMSATLRQGLVLSIMNPAAAAKVAPKAIKAFFSKNTAEMIDEAIRMSPNQYLRDRARLYLAPLDVGLSNSEEVFLSKIIDKIPGLAQLTAASERHMTTYLNMLRAQAFDDFVKAYPNATQKELVAWADFVNVASGRGNLGRLQSIAPELGTIFFAPRFAMSRIQTPLALKKHWDEPRVRKEIAKSLGKVAVVGATALSLAKMAGADVSLDPRSPDFAKIKIGSTRVDIWGGMQQPMRLLMRLVLGATDPAGITGRELTKAEKKFDTIEALERFAEYKLGPLPGIYSELTTGKTAVGEPIEPWETLAYSAIPLIFQDTQDAIKSEGGFNFKKGAWVGTAGFVGLGVSTYDKSKPPKEEALALYDDIHEAALADNVDWLTDEVRLYLQKGGDPLHMMKLIERKEPELDTTQMSNVADIITRLVDEPELDSIRAQSMYEQFQIDSTEAMDQFRIDSLKAEGKESPGQSIWDYLFGGRP